jgi:hypothetical protein
MVSTLALTPTQIEQQQEEMLRRKYGGLPSKKALLAKVRPRDSLHRLPWLPTVR